MLEYNQYVLRVLSTVGQHACELSEKSRGIVAQGRKGIGHGKRFFLIFLRWFLVRHQLCLNVADSADKV